MITDTRNLPTYTLAERRPVKGQRVMLTAKDRLGPYPITFPCLFDGKAFVNPKTGKPLEIEIQTWRPVHTFDVRPPYKPSRLAFLHMRAGA